MSSLRSLRPRLSTRHCPALSNPTLRLATTRGWEPPSSRPPVRLLPQTVRPWGAALVWSLRSATLPPSPAWLTTSLPPADKSCWVPTSPQPCPAWTLFCMTSQAALRFCPIWAQHSVNRHGEGTYRTKVPGAAGDPHLAIQPGKPRPPLERRMGPAPPTPTATGPEPAPRRLPGAPSRETWVRERLNELGGTSHVSTGI